jgi:colicin import membrane protein
MSSTAQQTTCRYPGCPRPAAERAGTVGSMPGYCYEADAPGLPVHKPDTAYRARQREAAERAGRPAEISDRPVSSARLSAASVRDEVVSALDAAMVRAGHLIEELRTVADPEAAAVEMATASADAERRVAEAHHETAQAEAARAAALAERDQQALAADELARQAELAEEAREAASADADVARRHGTEAVARAEAAEAEQAAVTAAAAEQVAQAQTEVERVRADAAGAIAAEQARADGEIAAAQQRADEAIAGIRTEAEARVQAEQRAAQAARERAGQLEQALKDAQTQHEERVRELREHLEVLGSQVRRTTEELTSVQQAATAAEERHRGDLAEGERRHGVQLEQERAAWTRAIASAEELGRSRTEDLAAVRHELTVVRGERDRLAEQVRELGRAASSAGSPEPGSEEPPADQGGRSRRRPGGGR